MTVLGQRLKALRKSKGITQKQMAEMLDYTEQHYQRIEYGKIDLPSSKLIFYSTFYEVSTDYLLGLSDDPTRH